MNSRDTIFVVIVFKHLVAVVVAGNLVVPSSLIDLCLAILWFANGKPCLYLLYYLAPKTLNFVRFVGHRSGVHVPNI